MGHVLDVRGPGGSDVGHRLLYFREATFQLMFNTCRCDQTTHQNGQRMSTFWNLMMICGPSRRNGHVGGMTPN